MDLFKNKLPQKTGLFILSALVISGIKIFSHYEAQAIYKDQKSTAVGKVVSMESEHKIKKGISREFIRLNYEFNADDKVESSSVLIAQGVVPRDLKKVKVKYNSNNLKDHRLILNANDESSINWLYEILSVLGFSFFIGFLLLEAKDRLEAKPY
ncbi:hypothetical protein [Pleionea mediterranea]|uniref:DUF3592 domain-containing protein n=1 Tax=Pleionea mediterranea TaxID=523701 RepID=A0A316FVV7_9GAMM|nr:hypothetical protein [Pleionea mediterranea]PWK51740.1 hypothetical protein C8D97_10555 [Pleionea mediterranea]